MDMESGAGEKHTCTHFPHKQRKSGMEKKQNTKKLPTTKILRPYRNIKHSKSFLVIKESSRSSTAENYL